MHLLFDSTGNLMKPIFLRLAFSFNYDLNPLASRAPVSSLGMASHERPS